MAKLQGCRILVFLLFAATAIAAPAQTFTTLASFDGFDGANPFFNAVLVQGRDGNYYGITTNGGANRSVCSYDCGTVFKITPAGKLTMLYSFCAETGCPDGASPYAGLVLATDGNFYGTTAYGGNGRNTAKCGDYGCGTVFKITPAGTLTTLYSFCSQNNCTDGAIPRAGLVLATNDNFYGTTSRGGARNPGTVFKITPAGKLTTLGNPKGAGPNGLIQATDGNFYGTTIGGAAYPDGSVFRITPGGKLIRLHHFDGTDGSAPNGLAQGTDGNFYGTTYAGGANHNCNNSYGWGCGTVFKITPAGTLTTLYSFCTQTGCPDGYSPVSVVQATDGNFYGTTLNGGANCASAGGCGTVFKITPAGKMTTLYSFCPSGWPNCADGNLPTGLAQATNGNFYGTTSYGGASGTACGGYGCGTVFSLSMSLGPFVTFVRNSGRVGANVEILGQGFTGTTGVSFNGTSANFMVHFDTYLTAMVPAGATTGFVTVTTPNGTLTSNVVFRVMPQIRSFTPTSGPVGTQVTIRGVSLTQTTKVTFGGIAATIFTVTSDTQVTATVPTGANTGHVAIATAGGTATSSGIFTVTQ